MVVIYLVFCLDEAKGRINGAPNETRSHPCRINLANYTRCPSIFIRNTKTTNKLYGILTIHTQTETVKHTHTHTRTHRNRETHTHTEES